MARLVDLWLTDQEGRWLRWGEYASVDAARDEWRRVAARSTNLEAFEVREVVGPEAAVVLNVEHVLYSGNYVTDEC